MSNKFPFDFFWDTTFDAWVEVVGPVAPLVEFIRWFYGDFGVFFTGDIPLGSNNPMALSFYLLKSLFYLSVGSYSILTKMLLFITGTLAKRLEISIHPILSHIYRTFSHLPRKTRIWTWNGSYCCKNRVVAHREHLVFSATIL